MGDGELSDADWMGDVDIDESVAATRYRVLGRRGARRMPEIAKRGFVDAGAGADDIDASEVLGGAVKHGVEGVPVCYVCHLENGFARMRVDKFLGFGTQGQVCEDDVGAMVE